MHERITEEKERINTAYRAALQWGLEDDKRALQLYAAQQALAWALEPQAARSPFEMIMDDPLETGLIPPASQQPTTDARG